MSPYQLQDVDRSRDGRQLGATKHLLNVHAYFSPVNNSNFNSYFKSTLCLVELSAAAGSKLSCSFSLLCTSDNLAERFSILTIIETESKCFGEVVETRSVGRLRKITFHELMVDGLICVRLCDSGWILRVSIVESELAERGALSWGRWQLAGTSMIGSKQSLKTGKWLIPLETIF